MGSELRWSVTMTRNRLLPLVGAGAFYLLTAVLAGPAFADAIDGDWCSRDGRRLSISGPRIVTPGGHSIAGTYSRHAFAYKVPANETGAGTAIDMTLADEHTLHLRSAGDPKAQVWKRCQKPGS